LFLCSLSIYSQAGKYYYGVNNRVSLDPENAISMKEIIDRPGKVLKTKTFTKTGNHWSLLRTERIKEKRDGSFLIRYFESTLLPRSYKRDLIKIDPTTYYFTEKRGETIVRTGMSKAIIPLLLEGKVTEYYKNETLKSESVYKDNMLLSNLNWLPDGSKYISNIFYSVDKAPTYINGQVFFRNYMVLSMVDEKIKVEEIQDEIIIGLVIMEDGTLAEPLIIKGHVDSVNDFLLRTIANLPGNWNPAELNGEKVRYFLTIPINFKNNVPMLQNLELTKSGQMFWDN